MDIAQALVLGVVEGITEFLPVSSTGHLTIAERLLGLRVDDPGVTAFTAIIQVGAIAAVLIYFRTDIVRLVRAWVSGLLHPTARRDPDYRLAWFVIAGSVPIGIVGFAARDLVSGRLRSLVVVAVALIAWSAVMYLAERRGSQQRSERDVRLSDVLVIGLVQCVALVPGVSRSGATISAALFRGLDRVTATRLSFFLSIPALTAAGAYEAAGSASTSAPASAGPHARRDAGEPRRGLRLHRRVAPPRRPPPHHDLHRLPGPPRRRAARAPGDRSPLSGE